jgi:dipeptidyl aminopeptidase/acylaminoacyl peptidase
MEGEAGDDHRIAFVSTRAGYRHIFTINENSFRLIQLTADFTYDSYPTWSLDGERLAFLRAQEEDSRRLLRTDIYLIDPVGEGHLNLTQGLDRDIFSIVWSPDDRSIAFNAGMLGNDRGRYWDAFGPADHSNPFLKRRLQQANLVPRSNLPSLCLPGPHEFRTGPEKPGRHGILQRRFASRRGILDAIG